MAATDGAPAPTIDGQRVEAFAEQVLGDLASTMASTLCILGDRLGLFGALAEGPATGDELAERADVLPRYADEWARGLVTAGYLDHDPSTGRFSLPAEHAAVLADEGGPAFAGGAYQLVKGLLEALEPVERAFRSGAGVPLEAYGDDFWRGMERLTAVDFGHLLVDEWIPGADDIEARLEEGARVADVGCGAGVAAITLARAFPRSEVTGIDIHEPNVKRAERAAREAGVADRVSFRTADATDDLPGTYDMITVLNVVHDTADPVGFLGNVRGALSGDGACVIQEMNCDPSLEEEKGPAGTLLYGISVLHCLSQAIANGGATLGTCGLPEARLREHCLEAGFSSLERVAEQPLDVVYVARP